MMTFYYTGDNCLTDAAAGQETCKQEHARICKALRLDPAEIPLKVAAAHTDGDSWVMSLTEVN